MGRFYYTMAFDSYVCSYMLTIASHLYDTNHRQAHVTHVSHTLNTGVYV